MQFIQEYTQPLLIIFFIYVLFILLHFKQTKINLKHINTKQTKRVPIGYSWLSLIFLFFVPLFRKDWEWFFIYFLVTLFTLGLAIPIIAYLYNKIYIHSLIKNGYIATSKTDGELLFSKILS
jgi:hypothetical protein